jgi:hypothetical protein
MPAQNTGPLPVTPTELDIQRIPFFRTIEGDPDDAPFLCHVDHLSISNFNLHAQQSRAVGFALGVDAEREGAAAAQRFVQQQVNRAEVWKFEAFHFALDEIAEELFHAGRSDFAQDYGVVLGFEGDHADVGCVAFVAGAGMRDGAEGLFHSQTIAWSVTNRSLAVTAL